MRVLIVGAGIGGLATALSLHAAGFDEITVIDSAPVLRPLGVGINLQSHATRELTELGLGDALAAGALPVGEFVHFDRHGNRVWGQPRGLGLGHRWPQYAIHRGELQMTLLAAVRERLGEDAVRAGTTYLDHVGDGPEVTARLLDRAAGAEFALTADVLVGADGLHSAVRRRLVPGEGPPKWNGVRMWRGMTETDPFLDGRTMAVLGSAHTVKFVAYPVSREADDRGRALVNWVAEFKEPQAGSAGAADWNRAGRAADALRHFRDWGPGWLDVGDLIARAPHVLEYPMVDRDPLPSWVFGRAVLVGDAAHPMYPLGSNGGSQAILDARALARELAAAGDPAAGLAAYDAVRREPVNRIVLATRANPADAVMDLVARRAPDGFDRIEDVITSEELAPLVDGYRSITHTDAAELDSRPSWTPAR